MRALCWVLPVMWGLYAAEVPAALPDEAGFELSYDDNLTRAQLERDIKDDSALAAYASAGPRYQITDKDSLTMTGTIAGTAYSHYHGLDNLSARLALAYRRKFGLGPYVPEIRLSGSATRLDYRDALRDGWLYEAELELGKRLSERWTIRTAYQSEWRRADSVPARLRPTIPADAFNQRSHSLTINSDFSYDPSYVLFIGYTLRDGDIVSTTQRNLPIFRASSAITADPVFGGDTFAYKMTALTRELKLGLSRLVTAQSSLSVAVEHQESSADGGIEYRANLIRATYLHSF